MEPLNSLYPQLGWGRGGGNEVSSKISFGVVFQLTNVNGN